MKVAILISLARQVEGEMVYINVLKAHQDPAKLQEYLKNTDLPLTGKFGGGECVMEYGVFKDIEVEVD